MTVTPAEAQTKASVSEATQACLACHAASTPGLTADREKSRHAKVTPEEALKKGKLEKRVSADKVPGTISKTVVGCAECHTVNSEKHKDAFEHNGYIVHLTKDDWYLAV